MTRLIDKRHNDDAVAFIEFFPITGYVKVYGKTINGPRRKRIHETATIAQVPPHLKNEAERTIWQRPKSDTLQKWCDEVWKIAVQKDAWFENF